MGQRGPTPKRSNQRRRRNVESRPDKLQATGQVQVPECPEGTHPIAARWYRSLTESAQAQYYEPSDWAAALLLLEQLNRLLASGEPLTGAEFSSVWSAMADLFTTEAARRRARIEVERHAAEPEATPAGISAIDEFRQRAQQKHSTG